MAPVNLFWRAEARALLPSNQAFGEWCSQNFCERVTSETARQYRMLHEQFGHVPLDVLMRVGLSNAYKLAAQPEPVRTEAIEHAQASHAVLTGKDVKALIARHLTSTQMAEVRAKVTAIYPPKPGGANNPAGSNQHKTVVKVPNVTLTTPPEESPAQTQAQAAEAFGVSVRTVKRWDKAEAKERAKARPNPVQAGFPATVQPARENSLTGSSLLNAETALSSC